MTLTSSRHIWRCRVKTATIPFSFDQLNTRINTLFCFINATPFTVQLKEGNPTILTLLADLKAKVEAAQPTLTLTTAYTRDTGLATITMTSTNPTDTLTIDYSSNPVVMQMMGFTATKVFADSIPLTSDRHVNVQPVLSLFVRSGNLTQVAGNREMVLRPDEPTDILTEIPVQTQAGTFIQHVGSDQGVVLSVRTIDQIQLYLSTTEDFLIDLKGLEWSVVLAFDEVILPAEEETKADSLAVDIGAQIQNKQQEEEMAFLRTQQAMALEDLEKQKRLMINALYVDEAELKAYLRA